MNQQHYFSYNWTSNAQKFNTYGCCLSLTLYDQKPITTALKGHEPDSNSRHPHEHHKTSRESDHMQPQQNAITLHYFHICMQVPNVLICDVSINVRQLSERPTKKTKKNKKTKQKRLNCSSFYYRGSGTNPTLICMSRYKKNKEKKENFHDNHIIMMVKPEQLLKSNISGFSPALTVQRSTIKLIYILMRMREYRGKGMKTQLIECFIEGKRE